MELWLAGNIDARHFVEADYWKAKDFYFREGFKIAERNIDEETEEELRMVYKK